jgi:hypothetical protein
MEWAYFYPSAKAKHIQTNVVFDITFKGRSETVDDIEFAPAVDAKRQFTESEVAALKLDFWKMLSEERIRTEMSILVNKEFAADPSLVARTLEEATAKKISARTVQSWLIEPGKPSSRKCPEWALKALKDYLSNPENKSNLDISKKYSENDSGSSRPWSTQVYDRHSVRFATNEILADDRRLKEWEQANFPTLARMLFELERRVDGYLSHLHDQTMALENGLQNSTTYEELRTSVREAIRDKEVAKYIIRDTRKAIESGTDEFSNDEGLPK